MYQASAGDFSSWREQARYLLSQNIKPEHAQWNHDHHAQGSLFNDPIIKKDAKRKINVPKDFIVLAFAVSCHRDPARWSLLYQALWRLNNGERNLLELRTDHLIYRLFQMEHAVRRDAHKAKAFIRFRKCQIDEHDHYIAWHRPDHAILPIIAPFFQRRFSVMNWTIMTSEQTVSWDGQNLHYSAGLPQSAAPQDDALEDLWRTYYRSTFNPARIKLKMMKQEMPVRYWQTLPEAELIPQLLHDAEDRVFKMLESDIYHGFER